MPSSMSLMKILNRTGPRLSRGATTRDQPRSKAVLKAALSKAAVGAPSGD